MSCTTRTDVHHVDTDRLVPDWLAEGASPDPVHGWLDPVRLEVRQALTKHRCVSVEATGAWDSDWLLAERLSGDGVRVLRVWLTAPVEVTLQRLAERTSARVPTTPEEARRLHEAGTQRAATQPFDAVIDTAMPNVDAVDELVRVLHDRAESGQAD